MSRNQSSLPRSVLAAFIVLLVLAAVVTYVRKPGGGGGRPSGPVKASAPSAVVEQDAPPSRTVLRETRREGTVYECTVVGRIEGTMRQTTELAAYHPIFKGDIRSAWIAPWTTRFSAEVLRNDGATIEERRTFEEVRSVELMAPAELAELTYDLDPTINELITKLAARLRQVYPGNPMSSAMGAVIRSQDFNYAEIAKLTGIQERILSRQEAVVAGTARVLDAFEGKSVEVALKDGRTEWIYAPDLPAEVSRTLGRAGSLLDYSALPDPELAVGERVVLSELLINEMMPPELMKEVLGDYDTDLTLSLTRDEDLETDGRTFQRFTGDGHLRLRKLDGNIYARIELESAALWIDVTDPHNRYLHRLTISMPLDAQYLQSHSRFRSVSWEGDLALDVRYQVELVQ